MKKMNIVISLGDPGGIGPEVTLKALSQLYRTGIFNNCQFILLGSLSILNYINQQIKTPFKFTAIQLKKYDQNVRYPKTCLPVLDVPNTNSFLLKSKKIDKNINGKLKFPISKISSLNGLLAIESLDWGIDICLRGFADALVTAPLNKEAVRLILPNFNGHTEYLKYRSGAEKVAMMFVADHLKMTLVTMHIPLNKVSSALSRSLIREKIFLTHHALRSLFNIRNPRIGVSALNPHGREFGNEEEKIILPAIKQCSKNISQLYGPIPGDEIFHKLWEKQLDVAIAMYHDQGLGPFKMVAFKKGVNLTVGLPFIRTSPDHGTAFDIANMNRADASPMRSAIELAIKLARKLK